MIVGASSTPRGVRLVVRARSHRSRSRRRVSPSTSHQPLRRRGAALGQLQRAHRRRRRRGGRQGRWAQRRTGLDPPADDVAHFFPRYLGTKPTSSRSHSGFRRWLRRGTSHSAAVSPVTTIRQGLRVEGRCSGTARIDCSRKRFRTICRLRT